MNKNIAFAVTFIILSLIILAVIYTIFDANFNNTFDPNYNNGVIECNDIQNSEGQSGDEETEGNLNELNQDELNQENNALLSDKNEDFEISVVPSNINETDENSYEASLIVDNGVLTNNVFDYDLYSYNLKEINVTINGETMPIKQALESGKITVNGIIEKANKDAKEAEDKINNMEPGESAPAPVPFKLIYKDGGSTEWHYTDYTIIKKNYIEDTPDSRDVFICKAGTTLEQVKKVNRSDGGAKEIK